MKSSEAHRPHIIYGMSKYLLHIPDLKSVIICGVMQKLLKMINYWIFTSHTQSNIVEQLPSGNHSTTKLDLKLSYEIEGIALLYLCNSSSEVRDLALEILQGIRRLAQPSIEISTNAIHLPPTRIIGIMEESGPDIQSNLENDFRFNVENPFPSELANVSLKTLIVSKHQMCWSYCLAQVVQLARELCPLVTDSIRKILFQRIEEISKAGVSLENEGLLPLWRNYITVACIIVKDINEAKELLTLIHGFLKLESHRDSVIFALQRANIDVMEGIIEVLKTYENESGAKKAKKRDKIRNDLGSIFSVLSERFTAGFLHKHEKTRNYFLHFIQDCISYLNDGALEDTVFHRYNYCTIVRHIALLLSEKINDKDYIPLDVELRFKLFKLFSQWTQRVGGPDPTPSEQATKKKKWSPTIYETLLLKMQQTASSAASAVLRGSSSITQIMFNEKDKPSSSSSSASSVTNEDPVLIWVRHMIKSDRRELCSSAIEGLVFYLDSNHDHHELCKIALDHCYNSDKDIASAYFLAIVEGYKIGVSFISYSPAILYHLILFKLGDNNIKIRLSAIQLLQILAYRECEKNRKLDSISPRSKNSSNSSNGNKDDDVLDSYHWGCNYSPPSVHGYLFEIYQQTQLDLSYRLANDYPSITFEFFDEFVYRLDSASSLHQKLMLNYLIAWVTKMKLNSLEIDKLVEVLKNLFWVTLKYDGDPHHFTHLVQIWETLAGSDSENIPLIIDFTLSLGVNKRNPSFIDLAKRVVIFLSHTNSQLVIHSLINELSTITPPIKLRLSKGLPIGIINRRSGNFNTIAHHRNHQDSSSSSSSSSKMDNNSQQQQQQQLQQQQQSSQPTSSSSSSKIDSTTQSQQLSSCGTGSTNLNASVSISSVSSNALNTSTNTNASSSSGSKVQLLNNQDTVTNSNANVSSSSNSSSMNVVVSNHPNSEQNVSNHISLQSFSRFDSEMSDIKQSFDNANYLLPSARGHVALLLLAELSFLPKIIIGIITSFTYFITTSISWIR